MFPSFISILDIQSWWEVPSIAHFCSLFRAAFNLLDFDIEDLEEALLTDGTEETSWLQELIVRLLSGCLPNNEISTFNYQMFLRRLFRQKCQETDQYNPFNTDVDFQILPLRTKVDILHALCDFRLDADDVLDQLKNLEADSLRVEPLGYDSNDSAYWYFYGTRLYREDFKTKNNKKQSIWQVICFTEEDWFQLTKKFKKSTHKVERQLYKTLSENFLPELPRLFKEKERLARKRLLENQPRRTSSRIRKLELTVEKEREEYCKIQEVVKDKSIEEEERDRKLDLETKRREAYERRNKLKKQEASEESSNEDSENRYEMAKLRGKKPKNKQSKSPAESSNDDSENRYETVKLRGKKSKNKQSRSPAESSNEDSENRYEMAKLRANKSKNKLPKSPSESTSSKDTLPSKHVKRSKKAEKDLPKEVTPMKVGRQTNNSLAAATGQIVIEPVVNPHRKKLKTAQVFRQTDEDLQTGMHKILDYIKNHEDAWPFADPVEEEYAPNYYTVIRKPMDLQRMEERLDSGYYKGFSKFQNDFQLIVDNCRLYNGAENEYTEMVGNLLKAFERGTEKYLDQISSSEDEIAVEYLAESDNESQPTNKNEKIDKVSKKRKPTLAVKTNKKRERSLSEKSESPARSDSFESIENIPEEKTPKKMKHSNKGNKKFKNKSKKSTLKKSKHDSKKTKEIRDKHKQKNLKEEKVAKVKKGSKTKKKPLKKVKTPSPVTSRSNSPSRSRSISPARYSSSPPLSWPPSSPEAKYDLPPVKTGVKRKSEELNEYGDRQEDKKIKDKSKLDKWKALFENEEISSRIDTKLKKPEETSPMPSPKPKDKHNKLRETIEKLKAKSEISHKLNEFEFSFSDIDKPKENVEKVKARKEDKAKPNNKEKPVKDIKKDLELDDGNSTIDSIRSENKKIPKKDNKSASFKNSNMEALSLATEQTLKDINKWLDDTPKFAEFSSASNSPSYTGLDDFDTINNKAEPDMPKKVEKSGNKKDSTKETKRRTFSRDPAKFIKRREVQRTIDRLQPGKSKGNLITNVQSTSKVDEIFPLGPLSKLKDTKNSLIVKTDENAPKLSLGSVLDSFGKHKFIDDQKKEEPVEVPKEEDPPLFILKNEDDKKEDSNLIETSDDTTKSETVTNEEPKTAAMGSATPNLSAWFKAFGAPKVQPTKKSEAKLDGKEEEHKDKGKVAIPEPSPNADSPIMVHGQPTPRQRKISTGSSMSERSSFSQDMDSPRVGIDERLGAYPAPYPSPLHRSPSGASPIMASPRPDVSPKAAYPAFNGQIRVGFYQDTVSTKSSPEKSCSPKDIPQSPHPQYSEHVYTPNTSQSVNYTYANSPYYSHPPNYSHTIPTPCNQDPTLPIYYDTGKSLIDQYQAKTVENCENSPASNMSSPSPLPQHSPNVEALQQEQKLPEKPIALMSNTVFPVKKRAYMESEPQDDVEVVRFTLQQDSQERKEADSCVKLDEKHCATPNQNMKPYVEQNIPEPKVTSYVEEKPNPVSAVTSNQMSVPPQNQTEPLRNVQPYVQHSNPYSSTYNEANYPLNVPATRPINTQQDLERKLDMSKYTNMGYTGPEVNFPRNIQQFGRPEMNYPRTATNTPSQPTVCTSQSIQTNEMNVRYSNPNASLSMPFKGIEMNTNNPNAQPHNFASPSSHQNVRTSSENATGNYKSDVSMSRPPYNAPPLDMDQSLSLRSNLSNLSHIVDRYNADERLLSGLPSTYYADKTLNVPHMFNKPISTSASALPIFSQSNMTMTSYNQNVQAASVPTYNRTVNDVQNSAVVSNESKTNMNPVVQEKKSKKRKSAKPATPTTTAEQQSNNQGFQSYAGLKNSSSVEPSAISLKTASVVPGSAFNFGPTASGLGIGSGLYGDKDAYPNFLDEFRATPNYYMAAAAAAHHRSTPESAEKQTRIAHQSSTPQTTSGYPFIGTSQGRAQSYPLGNPFINPAQAQLMDPSSPLYQHYLQAGVLNQGLLGPPGAYPPGYHPALSMRQPYDSMTRPTWL